MCDVLFRAGNARGRNYLTFFSFNDAGISRFWSLSPVGGRYFAGSSLKTHWLISEVDVAEEIKSDSKVEVHFFHLFRLPSPLISIDYAKAELQIERPKIQRINGDTRRMYSFYFARSVGPPARSYFPLIVRCTVFNAYEHSTRTIRDISHTPLGNWSGVNWMRRKRCGKMVAARQEWQSDSLHWLECGSQVTRVPSTRASLC